jgi:ATP/maltotriose-dependent transcriptional regulator MalT
VRLYSGEQGERGEDILQTARALIPSLEQAGAQGELATAWRLIMIVHGIAGQYRLASEAAQRSIAHARLATSDRLVAKPSVTLSSIALLGPTPVPEAISQCEKVIADGIGDRQAECAILCNLAQLKAMNGEIEEARALCRRGRATLRDLGQGVHAASTGLDLALVEILGGDLAFAEREARADYEFLATAGETYYLSSMAALLSRLVRDQGRDAEAMGLSRAAEAATAEDDVVSQALWRSIRAPILARAGDPAEAQRMARNAVDLLGRTEAPSLRGDALFELATVLRLTGSRDEARESLDEASALYRMKGNRVGADRCARILTEL